MPAGNSKVFRHQSSATNTQIAAAKNSEDAHKLKFSQWECKSFLPIFCAVTDSIRTTHKRHQPINVTGGMRASLMTEKPMRHQGVCGFLRHTPMSNQSGRRNVAPAGISRQEPDTPLAHRRPAGGCRKQTGPWQVASQQSLPPFPPATSFQPRTPANATIGHRSMPKKIHRCVGVDRPFVSGEHDHQPESPHSGVAHLAPE